MNFQQHIHFLVERRQVGHDRRQVGNRRPARNCLHNRTETPPQAAPVAGNVFLDGRLDQLAGCPCGAA